MLQTVAREQELSNLLIEKNYLKAIALAITLEQPLHVLNITKGTGYFCQNFITYATFSFVRLLFLSSSVSVNWRIRTMSISQLIYN